MNGGEQIGTRIIGLFEDALKRVVAFTGSVGEKRIHSIGAVLRDSRDLFLHALHRFFRSSHDLIPENLKLLTSSIKRHSKVFGRLYRALLDTLDRVVFVYLEACM
ncbi:hypothetical protein D3C77_378750 [compost metagenome]